MKTQENGGTPAALPELDAAEVQRLVRWSLLTVWPKVRRRGRAGAEWREEVTAQANLTACVAIREFDPGRGVGLPWFVRERVWSAVWTMCRREAANRARYGSGGGDERLAGTAAPAGPERFPIVGPLLPVALGRLPDPAKRLLVQVFWEGRKLADIAAEARLTRQAMSLRMRTALRRVKGEMRVPGAGKGRSPHREDGRGLKLGLG